MLGWFYLAGLVLAFTPCVLPMVPILSGLIAGGGRHITPARGFALSAAYVLGMALTYTVAGIACAAAGRQVQAVFQRSEEHTSELQSQSNLVCRLLLEKKK